MNETLKGVAHIGAELAAAKADLQREMERHRKTWRQLEQVTGLLEEAADDIRDSFKYADLSQADIDFLARIKAALSQQAEPAPAQDEREAAIADIFEVLTGHRDQVAWSDTCYSAHAANLYDAGYRKHRPAQTEQQPEGE